MDFQAPKSGIEPPRQSKTWRFKNRTQLLGGGLINDNRPHIFQERYNRPHIFHIFVCCQSGIHAASCLDVFGGHLVSDLSSRNGDVEEAEERGAQEGPSREVSGVGDGIGLGLEKKANEYTWGFHRISTCFNQSSNWGLFVIIPTRSLRNTNHLAGGRKRGSLQSWYLGYASFTNFQHLWWLHVITMGEILFQQ